MLEELKQKPSLEEKEIKAGLRFPLTYEDIASLDHSHIGAYIVQLSNGGAVILDTNAKSTSVVVAIHRQFSGIIGVLSAWADNGSVYIVSSSSDDNSLVNVLVKY